jgi:hypothetical protein
MKARAPKSKTRKRPRTASARSTAAYQVVGITSDGVKILQGKTKPTHFTSKEIRETIDELKRDASQHS